ncbi:MAG: hypothetical protein A2Y17_10920 [Clostridiales bacterium GWF2_38_85]|nr:MAG: hypothetical protein A2Y17_10920 [Clostridiales bacterium GWF2_38_85]
MMCETPNQNAFRDLPDRYSFRLCGRDELEIWNHIAVEEPNVNYVSEYYKKIYAKHEDEFFRRCTFVCNSDDKPIATCFLWRSYGEINTIGWFRTLPEYEGKGIGRALLSKILKEATFPVYLHTQPTSARAIKLYSDFGFKLITDQMIGYRKNNLTESLPFLQMVLPEPDYLALQTIKATPALIEAALSIATGEF